MRPHPAGPFQLDDWRSAEVAERAVGLDEVRGAMSVLNALTHALVDPLAAVDAPARAEPTSPLHPVVAGLSYAVGFCPFAGVGGDYYSIRLVGPDVGRFVIADVSGHGLPSAIIVALMRVLRAALYSAATPPTGELIVAALNSLLLGELGGEGGFVTGTIVDLNRDTGEVLSVNCGHPPPPVLSADGRVRSLVQDPTLPVGIVPDHAARPCRDTLDVGDTLVLYTDGIIEAMNDQREQLGVRGLDTILRATHAGASPAEIIERIEQGIARHQRGCPQADDRCLLVVRRN